MTSRWRGKLRAGNSSVRRGEIRWYTFAAPDKRRPVLILTRDGVLDSLGEIIVVPNTHHSQRLGPMLASLPEARWPEVERALLTACGFVRES